MKPFLAAAVQLNCNDDRERNLEQAFALIDAAAARGAEFIALPENADLIAAQRRKGRGEKGATPSVLGFA